YVLLRLNRRLQTESIAPNLVDRLAVAAVPHRADPVPPRRTVADRVPAGSPAGPRGRRRAPPVSAE
ncbi:hypothetical protein HBB16_16185, partial [Pseudonocardia sp. MCCB 268]|nr:hypothetical protein [Pseudonocardia cytotoxica]